MKTVTTLLVLIMISVSGCAIFDKGDQSPYTNRETPTFEGLAERKAEAERAACEKDNSYIFGAGSAALITDGAFALAFPAFAHPVTGIIAVAFVGTTAFWQYVEGQDEVFICNK